MSESSKPRYVHLDLRAHVFLTREHEDEIHLTLEHPDLPAGTTRLTFSTDPTVTNYYPHQYEIWRAVMVANGCERPPEVPGDLPPRDVRRRFTANG